MGVEKMSNNLNMFFASVYISENINHIPKAPANQTSNNEIFVGSALKKDMF